MLVELYALTKVLYETGLLPEMPACSSVSFFSYVHAEWNKLCVCEVFSFILQGTLYSPGISSRHCPHCYLSVLNVVWLTRSSRCMWSSVNPTISLQACMYKLENTSLFKTSLVVTCIIKYKLMPLFFT